jgi:hypothetical protein
LESEEEESDDENGLTIFSRKDVRYFVPGSVGDGFDGV